jgi:hypothetical protein
MPRELVNPEPLFEYDITRTGVLRCLKTSGLGRVIYTIGKPNEESNNNVRSHLCYHAKTLNEQVVKSLGTHHSGGTESSNEPHVQYPTNDYNSPDIHAIVTNIKNYILHKNPNARGDDIVAIAEHYLGYPLDQFCSENGGGQGGNSVTWTTLAVGLAVLLVSSVVPRGWGHT